MGVRRTGQLDSDLGDIISPLKQIGLNLATLIGTVHTCIFGDIYTVHAE